jgi:hypothetical protein
MIIEIEVEPGRAGGRSASMIAGVHITELQNWSQQHNIQLHYMKRKNTITVWFNDEAIYSFFSLTFNPKPVYNTQFNVLIEDYTCPWRIVSAQNPPQATSVNIAATDPEPVVYTNPKEIEAIKKSLTIVRNFAKLY